jgi:hypothetical protein
MFFDQEDNMPLTTLLAQNLDEYFLVSKATPEELWIFIHIPKTAGTSLGAQLAKNRTPSHNIWIDYSDNSANYHANMLQAVNKFLKADAIKPIRFATGHLEMSHVEIIRSARSNVKLITIMRNPVDRVISDYRYQLTDAHPQHKAFAARFKSVIDYVEYEGSRNRMFKRLTPRRPISNQELIDYLEAQFTFVGIQEMYTKSLAILSRLVGFPLDAQHHERKTVDIETNKIEVTEDLKDRIANANKRDMVLYRHFRRKLAEVTLKRSGPG